MNGSFLRQASEVEWWDDADPRERSSRHCDRKLTFVRVPAVEGIDPFAIRTNGF
jgi:hypothetical protein